MTPLKLSIHSALPEDLTTLADFNMAMAMETENKSLHKTDLHKGIQAVLEDAGLGFYLLAKMDKQTVGALMITNEWSDWRNGLFWWIQSVYVLPDCRRQGVFQALYHEVRNRALSADNVCGIRLYVERENIKAQQTYLAMGMIETHYRLFEEEFP